MQGFGREENVLSGKDLALLACVASLKSKEVLFLPFKC